MTNAAASLVLHHMRVS